MISCFDLLMTCVSTIYLTISMVVCIWGTICSVLQCSSKNKVKHDTCCETQISKQQTARKYSNLTLPCDSDVCETVTNVSIPSTSRKYKSKRNPPRLSDSKNQTDKVQKTIQSCKTIENETFPPDAVGPTELTNRKRAAGRQQIGRPREVDVPIIDAVTERSLKDRTKKGRESTDQVISFPIPATPYSVFEYAAVMSDSSDPASNLEAKTPIVKQADKDRPAGPFKIPDAKKEVRLHAPLQDNKHTQSEWRPLKKPIGQTLKETDQKPREQPLKHPLQQIHERPFQSKVMQPFPPMQLLKQPLKQQSQQKLRQKVELPLKQGPQEPQGQIVKRQQETTLKQTFHQPLEQKLKYVFKEPNKQTLNQPLRPIQKKPFQHSFWHPFQQQQPVKTFKTNCKQPLKRSSKNLGQPIEQPLKVQFQQQIKQPLKQPTKKISQQLRQPVKQPLQQPLGQPLEQPLGQPFRYSKVVEKQDIRTKPTKQKFRRD